MEMSIENNDILIILILEVVLVVLENSRVFIFEFFVNGVELVDISWLIEVCYKDIDLIKLKNWLKLISVYNNFMFIS